MSQNSKFLLPNSLFTCQRTRGTCPRRGVSVSGEAGTYPALFGLSTTFFNFRKFFFGAPRRAFLPGAEARTYLDSLSLSTTFFVFFQKTFSPRLANPCTASARLPRDDFVAQPKHLDNLHQNRFSVNHFLIFFRSVFQRISSPSFFLSVQAT